ncbi:hypothetical protein OG416_35715 (plasmid) [Streptomyces longwoodensis]|uniref:DUF6603 domain-containing protein n=1 Tax=Streptomyces longwoodensis TaxID=68231 RepID=UPI002F907A11|nr:hypothetical protein OG416_35715 [Streptomyces longwoodensis]
MGESRAPDPRREHDLLTRLWQQLDVLVRPLLAAGGDPGRRRALAEELGWDLAALGEQLKIGDPAQLEQSLDQWISAVSIAYAEVRAQIAAGLPDSLEAVKTRAQQAGKAAGVLKALPPVWQAKAPDPWLLPALAEDLADFLGTRYLRSEAPPLYRLLVLLGVIEPAGPQAVRDPVPAPPQAPVRLAVSRDRLRPDRLRRLLSEPEALLSELYAWHAEPTADQADLTAGLLFPRLADLLQALGVRAGYAVPEGVGPAQDARGAQLAAHSLTLVGGARDAGLEGGWGAGLVLSPDERGGMGLVVLPWGAAEVSAAAGVWNLALALSGTPGGFAWGPRGLLLPDGADAEVRFALAADRRGAQGAAAWTFGAPNGTRAELERLSFSAFARFGAKDADWGLAAEAAGGTVHIQPGGGDGDSFLRRILPAQGLTVPFQAGLGWTRRSGLSFTGQAGLEADLPLHLPLGPLTVDRLHLGVRAGTPDGGPADPVAAVEASLSARLALGPVTASVERLGLSVTAAFPPGGGNAGPMQVSTAFKLPTGIALSVDSDLVSGGGYLSVDQERGQYAGAAQLALAAYRLTAVGILTTRQADGGPLRDKAGRDIYSLLVIATGTAPAPPSPGFALEGLGVLVGLHRAADADALRAGVRTKALDNVLFPADPVASGPQLAASLSKLFPVAPDRYLLGLMARITWGPRTPDPRNPSAGTKALATADLALFVELPAPVRIGLLARVSLTLPAPAAPVVVLRMDAVGLVDLGTREASLDASLVESSVAGFPVTGDMALRAGWGSKRQFTLSIGGFHPRFTDRPKGFPELRRVAISLTKGDNPRVRVEGYLAVTSNTVQHGALVDVRVEKAGFTVLGRLGYDALIQFSPFGFVVDIFVSASVKRGSRTLLAVDLALQLSGPSPWHAKGHAHFQLWFISVSVGFEITAGRDGKKVLPTPVDPSAALLAALADPAGWSSLPPAGQSVVTLREVTARPGELLAHPLGGLTVAQRLLPLGVTVRRMGPDPLPAPAVFDIAQVRYGSGATARPGTLGAQVKDWFAPAQYKDMADAAKLSSPSFDLLKAGTELAAGALTAPSGKSADGTELTAFSELGYEPIVVDEPLAATAASSLAVRTGAGAAAEAPRTASDRVAAVEAAALRRIAAAAETAGTAPVDAVDSEAVDTTTISAADTRPVDAADSEAVDVAGSGAALESSGAVPRNLAAAPARRFETVPSALLNALAASGPAGRTARGSRCTAAGVAVRPHTWRVAAPADRAEGPASVAAARAAAPHPTHLAETHTEAWEMATALHESRPPAGATEVRAPGRPPRIHAAPFGGVDAPAAGGAR